MPCSLQFMSSSHHVLLSFFNDLTCRIQSVLSGLETFPGLPEFIKSLLQRILKALNPVPQGFKFVHGFGIAVFFVICCPLKRYKPLPGINPIEQRQK